MEHTECYAALPENTVTELDARDRVARRDAARFGRTHSVACRHAITASGKRVGRVGAYCQRGTVFSPCGWRVLAPRRVREHEPQASLNCAACDAPPLSPLDPDKACLVSGCLTSSWGTMVPETSSYRSNVDLQGPQEGSTVEMGHWMLLY